MMHAPKMVRSVPNTSMLSVCCLSSSTIILIFAAKSLVSRYYRPVFIKYIIYITDVEIPLLKPHKRKTKQIKK